MIGATADQETIRKNRHALAINNVADPEVMPAQASINKGVEMADIAMFLFALVPAAFAIMLFLITRRLKPSTKTILILGGLVVSLPAFGFLLALTIGIPFTRGHDHNPGVGVVFLPLILAWAVTFVMSLGLLVIPPVISAIAKYLGGKTPKSGLTRGKK